MINQVPACETIYVTVPHTMDHRTEAPNAPVATLRFATQNCICPTACAPTDVIDIEIHWTWCELIHYDPDNVCSIWPQFNADGGKFWAITTIPPFGIVVEGFFYLWFISEFHLYLNGIKVATIRRSNAGYDLTPWVYHGTIQDLLGMKITQDTDVTLTWQIGYEICAGCDLEWWPWDGSLKLFMDQYMSNIILSRTISVKIPPPPPPPDLHFDLDLCSVQASTVTPTQKFNIQIQIENNNSSSGTFYIGCFCKGAYQQLLQGTISGKASLPKTLTVTANQLAQMTLSQSDYLSFTLSVSNSPGNPPRDATVANPYGITGRWTPAAIYVNVTTPPPSGSANLSGQVTDKSTSAALANILVTAGGYSTSTNSSGNYSLLGLTPGTYTVRFTADGYDTVSQSKTLVAGNNTLNVAMTAVGEQPSIPWDKILGGGAIIAGVGIVLSQVVKGQGGKSGKR